MVDVTDACEIGTVCLLMHVVPISHKESASRLKNWLPIFSHNIIEIITIEGRSFDLVQWIEIKEFLWHIPRKVWL